MLGEGKVEPAEPRSHEAAPPSPSPIALATPSLPLQAKSPSNGSQSALIAVKAASKQPPETQDISRTDAGAENTQHGDIEAEVVTEKKGDSQVGAALMDDTIGTTAEAMQQASEPTCSPVHVGDEPPLEKGNPMEVSAAAAEVGDHDRLQPGVASLAAPLDDPLSSQKAETEQGLEEGGADEEASAAPSLRSCQAEEGPAACTVHGIAVSADHAKKILCADGDSYVSRGELMPIVETEAVDGAQSDGSVIIAEVTAGIGSLVLQGKAEAEQHEAAFEPSRPSLSTLPDLHSVIPTACSTSSQPQPAQMVPIAHCIAGQQGLSGQGVLPAADVQQIASIFSRFLQEAGLSRHLQVVPASATEPLQQEGSVGDVSLLSSTRISVSTQGGAVLELKIDFPS